MDGLTASEKFLTSLARESFLRFWSWANLYRDQGHVNRGGDGKEFCDLVVVFGDDVLLFSDKRILITESKSAQISWSRWAKKAIRASLKQVRGARRWLQEYPTRIFLDKKCTTQLPMLIPRKGRARYHSILVCHGLEEKLRELNSESSFSFDTTIFGEQHWSSNSGCVPFTVGNISGDGDFVHVFSESAIELVLEEFDTAKDFISYLTERKVILTWRHPLRIKSEADIVQLYYESYDDNLERNSIAAFLVRRSDLTFIDNGGISTLFLNRQFVEKKRADEISYFWDGLIESFAFHILNNTAESKTWQYPHEIEPGLRLLARLGRFERRILSEAFIDFYKIVSPGKRGTRIFVDRIDETHGYLFLLLPYIKSHGTFEKYRETRRMLLEAYCELSKLSNPEFQLIVGIGAQTRDGDNLVVEDFLAEGQDFITYDFSNWDENSNLAALAMEKKFIEKGLLSPRQLFESTAHEFPEA